MAGPQQKRNTLLRNARLAAGLSQFQLAEKIRVDEKSVQRWETGKSTPRPSILRALCDTLAKTPEELGFGYPEEAQSGRENQPTPQQAEQEQHREKQKQDAFPLPMSFEKKASLPLGRRSSRLLIGIVITLVVAILVGRVAMAAFSHTPILEQSDCGQPLSGAFHDPLDARWYWDDPTNHGKWQIDSQGSLSITTPPLSDLNPKFHLNAPRLLQPITGNFTIQTHLQFSPTMNFQGAGLLLWQDEHTFLRFERAHGQQQQNGILFQKEENNKPLFSIGSLKDYPTSAQFLDLRLQKQGDRFIASWQEPGHSWQTIRGVGDLHFDRLMVGLDVLADFAAPQTTATFTSFTVSCA